MIPPLCALRDRLRRFASVPTRPALSLGVATIIGVAAGLGGFTFQYAGGLSYLSPDPKACVNCHIMQPQYDSWQKTSHQTSATCVECHLPHAFAPKYLAKAENGWKHSSAFTLQDFDEPIRIKGRNIASLQANCVRCHGDLAHPQLTSGRRSDDVLPCVHCHVTAGHGDKAGLGGAATKKDARAPSSGDSPTHP